MSVEEAKGAVIRAAFDGSGALHVYLDRLILEVRAAMPCYQDYCGASVFMTEDGPMRLKCVPCTARTKLEAQEVTA